MDWNYCPTTKERDWMAVFAKMAEPGYPPAPPKKLTSVILALSAALPKQSTDEMRGETMLAVYQRQLKDLTIEEIEQAARRSLDELDWFPTIHQIKDRALGSNGKRLMTKEHLAQANIRRLLRNTPPPCFKELTESEEEKYKRETDKMLAELRAKGIKPEDRF